MVPFERSRTRTRMLAVACVALFLSVLVWFNYSAVLPLVVEEWGLSGTRAGVVFGAFQAGYLLAIVPAGLLVDRHSARYVVAVGAEVRVDHLVEQRPVDLAEVAHRLRVGRRAPSSPRSRGRRPRVLFNRSGDCGPEPTGPVATPPATRDADQSAVAATGSASSSVARIAAATPSTGYVNRSSA